jgi:hypothetical protein
MKGVTVGAVITVAERHRHRVEEETATGPAATGSFCRSTVTLVDLLSAGEGADVEFEPDRLGLSAQPSEL